DSGSRGAPLDARWLARKHASSPTFRLEPATERPVILVAQQGASALRHFSLVAAAVVLGVSVSARAADTAPTFSKDVAPIFYKHCAECHRPTMFAPMSLLSYETARPYARSIKTRVAAGTMPPWGADPHCGPFRN